MNTDHFLRAVGLSLRDLCEHNDFQDATVTRADGGELAYERGIGLFVNGELLSDAWLDDVGLVPA